ncbi:cilia- and flagella-associated protein 299 [Tachysurus ichikawai]
MKVEQSEGWRNDKALLLVLHCERTLASAGKELKDNFLRALAEREEANRSGKNHIFKMIGPSWKKQLPLMKSSVLAPYPPNVTHEMSAFTDVIDARCSCMILAQNVR